MNVSHLTVRLRKLLTLLTALAIALPAAARVGGSPAEEALAAAARGPLAVTVQRDGVDLSQAVEAVRRRPDVERIVSAETRVSNGREVHVIRYMTKDGKVRTEKVNGRKRN